MKCCFVPGCTSGYKATKNEKRSIFSTPKNPELLEEWRRAIPRKDKILSNKCFVCELHFHSDDIIRYNEIVMPDGMVLRCERLYPKLRDGAVPQIFPPTIRYTLNKKRKLPLSKKEKKKM